MFRLYDSTRRQICMAAFFGLCVLPTLGVAACCVAWHLPWHKQWEEERLSQELGLNVSIESMKHTLPGVVEYSGLRLTDPETGRELFRCGELAATWTSMTDSHGETRPAIVLSAKQAETATNNWQRLEDVLRRRLECQTGRPEMEIRLTADHCIVHGGNDSQVVEGVEGGVGMLPNGIQAQLAFRLPGANASQPVRMWIVRNRQVSPPADSFDVDTGPSLVPCSMLASSVKGLGALGPKCRFSGFISTFRTPEGWSGDISGQLSGVDLAILSRENALPQMTGTAEISIHKARYHGDRIDELAGQVVAGPGVLGRDALNALVAQLRLNSAPQLTPTGDTLPYDRMGFDFWIDARGVSIAGHCGNLPRAVAAVGGRAILSEPASQPQPVAALIRALATFDGVPVPATQETAWLARLLPVPETKIR